jgi:N-ethylmaleimide reductase
MSKLLTPYEKNGLTLKNHLVMAPMTRSRAIGNLPNDLMAEYYGQRTSAGLIITEGTAPMAEALGYPRIPGIFSQEQTEGWKKVTAAAHAGGSKIFLQLMHTGRVGHNDNMPEGKQMIGVSEIKFPGETYTDVKGMQEQSEPRALTTEGVKEVIEGHVSAAKNAVAAGFDGVELHGANGYLIEQFLNPNVNNRTDEYGGSIKNRAAFVLEIAAKTVAAIGKEKVGIRFSPYSTFNGLNAYDAADVHATYTYLAKELDKIGITYIHVNINPTAEPHTLESIRTEFNGTLIICSGFTPESAVTEIEKKATDLVAFGRPFIANPDLDKRIATNAPLSQPDFSTLFTSGEKGYTDYPTLN